MILIRYFEKKYPMLRCTEISQFLIDPPDFGIKVCQKVQINRSNTKLFQKTRILPVNGPLYPDSLVFENVQIRKMSVLRCRAKKGQFSPKTIFVKKYQKDPIRTRHLPKITFFGPK